MRAALGLRAITGGAAAVAIAVEDGQPRLLRSCFLATGEKGDALALSPYRLAAAMPRAAQGGVGTDASQAVAEGRLRQADCATRELQRFLAQLKAAGGAPTKSALLINRAGWITDLLEYSSAWAEHVPVAEGLAVRDALRVATRHHQLENTEVDEKSLPQLAAEALRLSPLQIDEHLKEMGRGAGRPWRKEQKLACLAAWYVIGVGD